MATLNLTQEQLDEMNQSLSKLVTALDNVASTKSAAKQAVVFKNNLFKEAIAVVREFNAVFQANKEIPSELIEQLGLNKHDTIPSHETPFQPTDLLIKPLSTGTIKIDWSANGNKPGTQYIIEVKYALDGNFQNVDTVTATKYDHKNQTPGVPAWYRITPRRGKLVGESSEVVSVYN